MPNHPLTIQGGIATLNLTCGDAALLSNALHIAAEHSDGKEFEAIRLWQMVFQGISSAAAAQLHLPPASEEGMVVFLGNVYSESKGAIR